MNRQSQIALGVFGGIAVLPAFILLVSGLFFFFGALIALFSWDIFLPDGSLDIDFIYLFLSYIAGIFAVVKILLIYSLTIRGRTIRFSKWLVAAIVSGCLSSVGVWLIGGFHTFAIVVLPPVLLSAWLLHIQFGLRKKG
jgi:hypothetical protein